MRKPALILAVLLASACGEILTYDDVPSYESVSRVVTPEGKVLRKDGWSVSIPPGAVSSNLIVDDARRDLISNPFSAGGNQVPVFILADNDKFLKYRCLWTFYPRDHSFNKNVTIGFSQEQSPETFILEYQAGADSTKVNAWIDRTEAFRDIGGGRIGMETGTFNRYLVTEGYYDDAFYMDEEWTSDFPYYSRKAVAHNEKFRATIVDANNGIYLLNLFFVNPPAHGNTYTVFDATSTGTLNNTNNNLIEIEAGFECYFPSGGGVSCARRSVSKSGTIKYLVEPEESGIIRHKVFFRDVVIRDTSSGKERHLNGYYQLVTN